MNVQLCDGYELDKEILVIYTEKGKQVMILDLGAPVTLAGNEWMDQYIKGSWIRSARSERFGVS